MHIVYKAREREATTIPISEILRENQIDIYPEILNRGYFDVRLSGAELVLTAGKYIGFIPLNDRVLIEVEPKIPAFNLLHILARADGDIKELDILKREYAAGFVFPSSIFDAIANAFARSLRKLEMEGLLKQYSAVTDAELKGQILFGESLRSHWSRGQRHKIVSSYYDLTSDTPQNRLLYFACYVLVQHYLALGRESETLTVLGYYHDLFASLGVSLSRPSLPGMHSGQLISPFYKIGLRLAEAIILNQGIALPGEGSDLQLSSFLIDMETVFEKYLRTALSRHLTRFRVLDGNFEGAKRLFDDRSSPPAKPDIVISSESQCLLVGDVKYKPRENRTDLNQILTYAMCYRVNRIVLFLPVESASERGLTVIGKINSTTLYRYRFNLAADSLDIEEQLMADAISNALGGPPAAPQDN